jgi:uncharacterized membrane protein YeaQ/YmgE (transglycosylase-associated protein family)
VLLSGKHRERRWARRRHRAYFNESLLVILVVGLVAGWLAGKIVRGAGFGLIGDLVIGIIGAFIGDWLLPRIGIHLGTGIISAIVNATIGAVLLLFVFGLVRGRFGAVGAEAGEDAVGGSGLKMRKPREGGCGAS